MRVCSSPGCPELIPSAGRCAEHERLHNKARGTTAYRGYGPEHRAAREQWKPIVATGNVECSRCYLPITAGERWHLDHDDNDRTKYRGPSHARCNTSAGGRNAHQ